MIENISRIKDYEPLLFLLDKAFEEEFNVTTLDISSSCRQRIIASYRVLYVGLAKEIANHLTWNELGVLVNRNHSTAIWHLKKYNDWLQVDKKFRELRTQAYNKYKQLKNETENGLD